MQFHDARQQSSTSLQINHKILIGLTVISLLIRLFKISNPSQVVFDEVHFGGFSTKYINGEFFMDVHPPLGKLMFAATGLLSGSYNSTFSFSKIGTDYKSSHVPYVMMRLLPGTMGALLVPVAYITCRNFELSNVAGMLVAGLLMIENGFVTQSRLILLDSGLLFFTGLTLMFWSRFLVLQEAPFSTECTIINLWTLLGDTRRITFLKFMHHFVARATCLILVPLVVYTFWFQIHFWSLPKKGGGSGFMSPEFQVTLRGTGIKDTFIDVGFGSVITLRHHATTGGYLHSHKSNYPAGSKQQQITLYPFNDPNSEFLIERPINTPQEVTKFEPIKDGDIIRLKHVATNHRLHSHDIRAPITDNEHHNEVSAYGGNGTKDTNDHWRVQIIGATGNVKAVQHKIKLVHVNRRCTLFSQKVKLPEWVSSDARKANYIKPGFLSKFIELHAKMWEVNSGLTNSHPYDSRPPSWPFLKRGINFWTFKDEKTGIGKQIYLIGNPLIWWVSTLSVLTCVAIVGTGLLLVKRKIVSFDEDAFFTKIWGSALLVVSGWGFHYLPFYLMKRQLFLHHYFPALYFAILSIGVVFEFVTCRLSKRWRVLGAGCLFLVAFLVFLDYSPLTYGFMMHKHHCERLKLRNDWDWSCVNSPKEEHELLPHPAEKLHHEDDHKLEHFVTNSAALEAVNGVVGTLRNITTLTTSTTK
ncbi:UNVERIFIED_CONTAM: hypothetical protein HDU68_010981 [Siphonaria sp. JEL0065]|nr:hypothetical protein HDU68_010981 [Siphonaria sp. JEL0065]